MADFRPGDKVEWVRYTPEATTPGGHRVTKWEPEPFRQPCTVVSVTENSVEVGWDVWDSQAKKWRRRVYHARPEHIEPIASE